MGQRHSGMVWITAIVWMIVVFPLGVFFYHYAYTVELPISVRPNFWIVFLALEFLVTLVHELGHALAVWAVHYRLKMISAGPVTLHRDGQGRWQWHFDRKRLFAGGGSVRAVPHSGLDPSLRANVMIILFGGPFVTLLCGAALFLLFINLPGTALAGWWEPAALSAALFTASFFRNMTPVSTTDGNRLLQLVRRSQTGEEFLKRFVASVDHEQAEQSKAVLELDDEIASRTRALEQIRAAGGADRLPLAAAYHNLGIAQFNAMESEHAEANLKAGLEILQQCRDPQPAMEGNIWSVLCHMYCLRHQADRIQTAYGRALSAFERAEKKGGVDPVQMRLVLATLHLHARFPDLALREIEAGFAILAGGLKHAMTRATLLRLRAESEFTLGCPERGLAAAREAAALLRSTAVLASEGRQAAAHLKALGSSLWEGGQSAEGILVCSEAVAWLEANGARRFAARCRIGLTGMLRKDGRLAEAESALPAEADLPPNKKRVLCTIRARIRLAQQRFEDATNDFERCIEIHGATDHPNQINLASPINLAIDKNGLACALFSLGRVTEAERQAQGALEILLPARHPDAAEALFTLALIGWQGGKRGADEQFEQGIRCTVDATLLKPAEKARSLEDEVRRLRYHGRENEAARAQVEAQEQWRLAGVEVPVAVPC